jgi:hypothetical protein
MCGPDAVFIRFRGTYDLKLTVQDAGTAAAARSTAANLGAAGFGRTADTNGFTDVPCLSLEALPPRLRRSGAAVADPTLPFAARLGCSAA